MITKSKFVEQERILDNLDTVIRDAEIRAFFKGLELTDLSYEAKLLAICEVFIVSYETAKKVISAKK